MDPQYEHIKGFIPQDEADGMFTQLLESIPWEVAKWKTGKPLPRMVCPISDSGLDEHPVFVKLRQLIYDRFKVRIRGIWGNLYRDNNDFCPEHQDSYGGYVFTFCFGQERELIFRKLSKNAKGGYDRTKLLTQHGDLYYFSQKMDADHKHSVPKSTANNGQRISIVMFA